MVRAKSGHSHTLYLGNMKIIIRTIDLTALIFSTTLSLRALLTIDPYYDSLAYHLPFASRLAGICPKSCYQMGNLLESIYDGFPKLYEWLVGTIWAATGSLQMAHLLNLLALILFCVYLRQWFRIPPSWSFVGLLAVPLIQIHVTSGYIDLPLNLAASAAILSLMVLAQSPESFGLGRHLFVVACLALVANSKYQMLSVAAALGVTLFALVALPLARGRRVGPWVPYRIMSWLQLLVYFGVAGMVVSAWSINNLMTYNNPFYPLDFHVFGIAFTGPYTDVVDTMPEDWISKAWADVPSPLRWLASVLEIQAYDFRPLPWNIDQGNVAFAAPSFRMGGYFVSYVLFLCCFLVWRLGAIHRGSRLLLTATFLLMTLLVVILPAAHILRYYAFWIIVLVSICLISVFDARFGGSTSPAERTILGCGILIALTSVVLITGAQYVTPFGVDIKGLSRQLGIERNIADIDDGTTVCVDPGWQPFTFLFASIFHPGRSYSVLDGPIGACTVVIRRD